MHVEAIRDGARAVLRVNTKDLQEWTHAPRLAAPYLRRSRERL